MINAHPKAIEHLNRAEAWLQTAEDNESKTWTAIYIGLANAHIRLAEFYRVADANA